MILSYEEEALSVYGAIILSIEAKNVHERKGAFTHTLVKTYRFSNLVGYNISVLIYIKGVQ